MYELENVIKMRPGLQVYTTAYPTTVGYTFFSSTEGILTKIYHILRENRPHKYQGRARMRVTPLRLPRHKM